MYDKYNYEICELLSFKQWNIDYAKVILHIWASDSVGDLVYDEKRDKLLDNVASQVN